MGAINNPVMDGLQAYALLNNQFRADREDTRVADHQARQEAMAAESHNAQMGAIQKKNDLDTTQALSYAVGNAQASGADTVDASTLSPQVQALAQKNGWLKTRVNTDGTESVVLDPDKITPDGLKQVSPLYSNLDENGVKQTVDALGVMKQKLNDYAQHVTPGAAGPGKLITMKDDPELFNAANIALAPSINKGLDNRVAQKKLTGAAINPDGTISFEVESFDKNGKSLGIAPITYDRANNDPNSMVLKLPATSLYDYIDANHQFGELLKTEQVKLGDEAPLKEQAAALKSKRVADALAKGTGEDADGTAKERLTAIQALTAEGVSPENATAIAKTLRPDKIQRQFSIVNNVAKDGKIGAAPMDIQTGAIDMDKWVETKQPKDAEAIRAQREADRDTREEKKASRKTVDGALKDWRDKLKEVDAERTAIQKLKSSGVGAIAGAVDYTRLNTLYAEENELRHNYEEAMKTHHDNFGENYIPGGKVDRDGKKASALNTSKATSTNNRPSLDSFWKKG